MLQKFGEKTTVWMVQKPLQIIKKLPTSTGEFTGFLNHQQYYKGNPFLALFDPPQKNGFHLMTPDI